jgi:hypothetical protein
MSSPARHGLYSVNISGIRNLAGYDLAPIEWERVRDTLASDITQAPDTGGPNRITAATMFAFGTAEPYGATRFDLTR